jgi:hypothetical protein
VYGAQRRPAVSALAAASERPAGDAEDLRGLQREIIDFDSERAMLDAFNGPASAKLDQFVEIE